MSELQNKFTAIDIIEETILYPLKSQILKEIKISSEEAIDKILLEPERRLNFVQSILQKMTATVDTDQQVTPLSQLDEIVPVVLQNSTKLKQPRKKSDKKLTIAKEEIAKVVQLLKSANSREEGQTILNEAKYTVNQLKSLAKYLGISKISSTKASLIEQIIQNTIGDRIEVMIIQDHKWDK